MIEVVEQPQFTPREFLASRKKPGISAVLRLRNEEDYVGAALDSIAPFFDEFVIVHGGCTDRTPEIVAAFEAEDPDRVKVYHYRPEVFPQGSSMHRKLSPRHVSSLVHYTNYALSRASYQIRLMWDGDMVASKEAMERVTEQIRSSRRGALQRRLSPWGMGLWWYTGVNLWDEGGKIFVPQSKPVCGTKREHAFWSTRRGRIYRHYPEGEYLRKNLFVHKHVGFLFYHVKGMKHDRGVGVYQFESNPDSLSRHKVEERWTDPPLMSWEEFCEAEPGAGELPRPETVGIHPIR